MPTYYLYLLQCADQTYYAGICIDPARRLAEHNGSNKAARYTRSRRPVRLVFLEECGDRSTALKREHILKKLSRSEKAELAATWEKLPTEAKIATLE